MEWCGAAPVVPDALRLTDDNVDKQAWSGCVPRAGEAAGVMPVDNGCFMAAMEHLPAMMFFHRSRRFFALSPRGRRRRR